MHGKYRDWIASNVHEAYGACAEVTLAMVAAFPELARVRGHYYCHSWGERSHWWCLTADGSIVDPTAAQFPSKGMGHYDPWEDTMRQPTGKCQNCGELVYTSGTHCSDECATEAAFYLMNPTWG